MFVPGRENVPDFQWLGEAVALLVNTFPVHERSESTQRPGRQVVSNVKKMLQFVTQAHRPMIAIYDKIYIMDKAWHSILQFSITVNKTRFH